MPRRLRWEISFGTLQRVCACPSQITVWEWEQIAFRRYRPLRIRQLKTKPIWEWHAKNIAFLQAVWTRSDRSNQEQLLVCLFIYLPSGWCKREMGRCTGGERPRTVQRTASCEMDRDSEDENDTCRDWSISMDQIVWSVISAHLCVPVEESEVEEEWVTYWSRSDSSCYLCDNWKTNNTWSWHSPRTRY